jgi:hypothetical protein
MPMTPGKPETIRLRMRCCGQRFEPGQRIRLAIATSHWPIVFPTPEQATLSIHCAGARFVLPARPSRAIDAELAPFPAPESATPLAQEWIVPPGEFSRTVTVDQINGETNYRVFSDLGTVRHLHTGMVLKQQQIESFTVHPDDPTTARGTCSWTKIYQRNDWKVSIDVQATVRGLKDVWRMETHIVAKAGEEVVLDESQVKEFPRDLN